MISAAKVPRDTTPFTYSDLPTPVAAEVRDATARIKDRPRVRSRVIIETGRDLLEVKAKIPNGQFKCWVAQELGMSDRMARAFMQAVSWAGKS